MFDLQEFLRKLDILYKEDPKKLETYLRQGLSEARALDDFGASLIILNELMGYYRVMSRFEECSKCADEAMELSKEMGIVGTVNYGTVLLNVATAYRVMGRMEEAEELYHQVHEIYRRQFEAPDYRMATLHNNLSLLYSATGRYEEAKKELSLAMELIRVLAESETEIAITHTNMGNLCFQMQQTEEGFMHMEEAVRIFEKQAGTKDPHYASALSGLGEAYFRTDQLEQSVACYEKALEEIDSHYGKNDYYRVTQGNLCLVKETLERKNAILRKNLKGLQIAKRYYETYGLPMLKEKYSKYMDRMAVGLVGEGSECLGYDDTFSVDHDFGPGFCIWLSKEDYDEIGAKLQEDYEKLPKEFIGFPARNTTSHGEDRVGVQEIGSFFQRYTGYECAPQMLSQWWDIPQEALKTVTNGEVFFDGAGEFTKRQEEFRKYPEKVRLRKLALALGKMAQAGQYNYGRMKKRKDEGASYLSLTEFVNSTIEAAYLLNRIYMPFYKWKMRGMDEFTCLKPLKNMLEELMVNNKSQAEEKIEEICALFVKELNNQNLTDSKELFLEVHKEIIWKSIEA